MDDQLNRRLQEILEAAEAVDVEIDILPIRNEIEDAENRLAGFVRENRESLSIQIESLSEAVHRLHERLDGIAGTVEAMQAELPSG